MGLANALSEKVDVEVIHPESFSKICGVLANGHVQLRAFARPVRRRHPANLLAIYRAFRLIEKSKPDVLHVQESCDYAYDLYSAIARFPPLVTTIHDVVPHPGDGHAAPGLQYTKAVSCWRSSKLIVHTSGMREQLAQRFRVSQQKIDVIPHGELGSLYQTISRSAGIPEMPREPYTLLFFGRIWPYKGLRFLLQAFSEIRQEIPEARLIIAGQGGDLVANEVLISSLEGVEVLKSFIPAVQVAGLFERSSIVVLPYIEASQSGVSAIGFTMGTVVVASRVGGLADLIEDQRTGVLVEPRDPAALASTLISILRDQKRQSQIRKNALALGAGALNWTNIAENTLATYQSAIRANK
jgi:glycosyltransferase involved in cell wall biosynthesis